MKVGIIGLGRMGEGMSRRMLKAGIEVWGYRRNYAKAQEAYEAGYVSGVATSLESLVQVVHNQEGMVGQFRATRHFHDGYSSRISRGHD